MASFCDVCVLLSLVFWSYIDVAFLTVYVHVFSVFKRFISKINKTSDLYIVYNVFITQTFVYLKGMCFIFILSSNFILLVIWVLYIPSQPHMNELPEHFGYFLTWMFDNEWLFQLEDYIKLNMIGASRAISVLSTILIYFGQFIFKNVIYRFFFSVVIGGYTKSREANEYLVTEENIDILLQAWLQHDAEGKGYIEVQNLLSLLIELPPPFFPNQEDLLRSFNLQDKELESKYPLNYPFFQEMDEIEKETLMSLRDKAGIGQALPRSPYFRSIDSSRVFSVAQYFLIGRLMNLNIYQLNKKE